MLTASPGPLLAKLRVNEADWPGTTAAAEAVMPFVARSAAALLVTAKGNVSGAVGAPVPPLASSGVLLVIRVTITVLPPASGAV